MMETQTARCRVDDIAGSVLPTGNLFFVWVTLNEQKWISFAERRGTKSTSTNEHVIAQWLLRDLRVPFGGMKQSGVGREGGDEAIRFFTEAKTVCVKYPTDV